MKVFFFLFLEESETTLESFSRRIPREVLRELIIEFQKASIIEFLKESMQGRKERFPVRWFSKEIFQEIAENHVVYGNICRSNTCKIFYENF